MSCAEASSSAPASVAVDAARIREAVRSETQRRRLEPAGARKQTNAAITTIRLSTARPIRNRVVKGLKRSQRRSLGGARGQRENETERAQLAPVALDRPRRGGRHGRWMKGSAAMLQSTSRERGRCVSLSCSARPSRRPRLGCVLSRVEGRAVS